MSWPDQYRQERRLSHCPILSHQIDAAKFLSHCPILSHQIDAAKFLSHCPILLHQIGAAKFLGDTTAVYRWYALAYLVMCFLVIPLIWMGMAIASTALVVVVSTLVLVVLAFITIINVMQNRFPEKLPAMLQDWTFLPLWMRSLEPLDRVVCSKIPTPKCCKAAPVTAAESTTACAV